MANRLEVEIGAKIKDFQNKVAQALKLTDKLKDKEKELKAAYKAGTISQDKYYKSLAQNASRLSRVSKASNTYKKNLNSLSGGMNVASKSIGDGSSAMLAFSRTVQDAPFGMMGISNNITNLTEQFGALKKRTGSAGGALKAMLKDLSGFGGITLAISLATSAWLMFGDKIMGTKDNIADVNKENKEFIEGLKSLETTLNGLTLSQDQLNAKIEDYILLQKIKANADKQEKQSTEKLEKINENLAKEKEKLAKAQRLLNANTIAYGKSQDKETTRAKGYAKGISDNNNLIAESTAKITSLEKQRKDVILDSLSILKKYRQQRDKLKESEEGSVAFLEKQKSLLEKEQKQVSKNSKTWQEYADKIKNIQKEINNITGTSSKRIEAPVFIDFKLDDSSFDIIEKIDLSSDEWIGDNAFDWDEYFKLKDFDLKQQAVQAKLLEFNNSVQSIMQGSLSSTFSQLGQSLGEALATGGNAIQAVGNAIIQGISGFLGKLGKMMIEYGTMAIIKGKLDLAIAAGGPVAIGAGIAAIAVGTALTALSGAMGSFASSGGNNDTSNAGSSSSSSGSTSFSGGASASNSGGTYVFEIAGTKLVGVLKNTLDRNKNLGGTLSIT